jgi:predicted RNA binding protein YcfA (HicA-like mRNA interferase family)
VSDWPSVKAKHVLRALIKIGWAVKRQSGGSHKVLERAGWPDVVFAFHDGDEIGPRMLVRVAKKLLCRSWQLRLWTEACAMKAPRLLEMQPGS